jgi:hypothetical protein
MDWSTIEEKAFEAIMASSGMQRLAAIRLLRRCRNDVEKALKIATQKKSDGTVILDDNLNESRGR